MFFLVHYSTRYHTVVILLSVPYYYYCSYVSCYTLAHFFFALVDMIVTASRQVSDGARILAGVLCCFQHPSSKVLLYYPAFVTMRSVELFVASFWTTVFMALLAGLTRTKLVRYLLRATAVRGEKTGPFDYHSATCSFGA